MLRATVLTVLTVLALVPRASAQTIGRANHEVVPLAQGHTLVTSVNNWLPGDQESACFVLDQDRRLVHFWPVSTLGTHSAYPTTGWDVLITDYGRNRVIEVTSDGTILWDSDTVSPLSDGTRLEFPNDAKLLANGNILISELGKHRVLEIDRAGTVLWKYPPSLNRSLLDHPHNPNRLANGNTLVADSGNNRILELDASAQVVWSYQPSGAQALASPRDVDPLPNGQILIADSFNQRLVIVDRVAGVQSTTPVGMWLYDADLLPSGNYLLSGGEVREVDPTGQPVWVYPPPVFTVVEPQLVLNPTSGVMVSYSAHRPVDSGPNSRRPAVVFVPDKTADGADFSDDCDYFATQGFIAVRFDPDGRGASTGGGSYTTEDYGGTVQQDGLHQVLLAVAARADVDPTRIAVASYGYGVTMAAGCLARHPDDPPVVLLRDWEGPASRAETAAANGGFVPVEPTAASFWAEREAITFVPQLRAAYVRHQTVVDHEAALHPQNFHAVDLNAAAVSTWFGGGGTAPRARVNAPWMNPSDVVWSLAAQPRWVDESVDHPVHDLLFLHLALERAFSAPRLEALGAPARGTTVRLQLAAGARRAGQPFALFLSPGVAPVPPRSVSILTVGVLDGAGLGVLPVPVPNAPALAGLPVFAWGAVALPGQPQPYRFTAYTPFVIQ